MLAGHTRDISHPMDEGDIRLSLCPGDELYPFEARGWFHTFDHKIIINSHAILFTGNPWIH